MVELRDAVRGNWLWLVVAVPTVTALIAGAMYLASSDETWETTGDFSIREYAPGQAAADIRAVTSSFENALGSRPVAEGIDAVEGVDPVTSPIEIRSAGEGGDIRVAISAPSPEAAEEALTVGVRRALAMVSASEGRRSMRELVASEAVASDTIQVLLEIENRAGAANLADEAARRSADILTLRNQIASAEDAQQPSQALQRVLADKVTELQQIEAELLQWNNLRARLDLAVASGAGANLRIQQVATGQAELETGPVLSSLRTAEASSVTGLLRVVVAAALGAGVVMVLLALTVGADRRRGPEGSLDPVGPHDGRPTRSDRTDLDGAQPEWNLDGVGTDRVTTRVID